MGLFVVFGFGFFFCKLALVFEEKAVFHKKQVLLWSSLHLVFREGRFFVSFHNTLVVQFSLSDGASKARWVQAPCSIFLQFTNEI